MRQVWGIVVSEEERSRILGVFHTAPAKIAGGSAFNRVLYNLLSPVGYKLADVIFRKERPSLFWRLRGLIHYVLIARPLIDKFGLLNARVSYSGGGAISPDIVRLFASLRIKIRQFYGSTEGGLCTGHQGDDIKPESCGPPLPDITLRVSDEGELYVKCQTDFTGYYKEHEATMSIMTEDGWLKTGDFGHIDDDGHLIIIDRMSDLTSLADGHKFSPQYIETRLRFSHYIRDALVVGGETEITLL